jgi:hypothetical protein
MSFMASARAALLMAAAGVVCSGCGGGSGAPSRPETLYASWSIDEVAVRRGEVRVGGSVDVDPDAGDLEIVDGTCMRRSLGGGMWTRTKLVWRFSADDIGAALGCSSRFGLRAKRTPTSMASVSSYVSVRLAVEIESEEEGEEARLRVVRSVRVTFDKDEAVVEAIALDGRALTMSVVGATFGPTKQSDDASTFRVPTSALVLAALRQSSVRFVAGGEQARASVSLFIDEQLVNSKELEPPEPEEPS